MYTDHEERLLSSLTVKVLDQERNRIIDSRSIDLSVVTVRQWFRAGRVGGDAETVTGGDGGLTVHYPSVQYNDVYCR